MDVKVCSICRDELSKKATRTLDCHVTHIFHKDCLGEWFKQRRTCPLCRQQDDGDVNAAALGFGLLLWELMMRNPQIVRFFS